MIIDTSVLVHVLFGETGWQATLRWLAHQPRLRVSAPSWAIAQAVLSTGTLQAPGLQRHDLRTLLNLDIVPFDAEQADATGRASARFGRGSGHPARLNFGDVLTYGLAASHREPLAYVGADFGHTDLETIPLPTAALGA